MTSASYIVHIDDVPLESQDKNQGWTISEFRLPLSNKQGSRTAVFHSRFHGVAAHEKHIHTNCEEILFYLKGRGKGGLGDGCVELRPGAFRLTPINMVHWGQSSGESEVAESMGFYVGSGSVKETGYVYTGEINKDDFTPFSPEHAHLTGRIEEVEPMAPSTESGWENTEVRILLSETQGCTSTLYHARLLAGGKQFRHIHQTSEEIIYVTRGSGIAGTGSQETQVREGHLLFIPQEVEHWLFNSNSKEPLEVIGLFTGAGSLAQTGYQPIEDHA